MLVTKLLEKLSGVRKTGRNRWIARCPAHGDRSPSLSIRESGDTVLIHCFAGCHPGEVLSAVGMRFEDLWPDHDRHIEPRKMPAADALACVAFEALVVVASAGTMRERPLTEEEMGRLVKAAERIQAACDMAGVRLETRGKRQ